MAVYDEILQTMQDTYRELSGSDADAASDIGIRMRVLAQRLEELYGAVDEAREQVFPQTSTGVYLERHAEAKGFRRKPAVSAVGTLRFTRTTPAASDIPVPVKTVCATRPDPQIQFETTREVFLKAGQSSVEVPARAVKPGEMGNTAAASVCLLVSSVPGITGVTNPAPFSGGLDEEGDDSLRQRLLDGYRNISNGTNRAFYRDIALSDDGVLSVNVIPRARGRGTVDVVVSGATSGSENVSVQRLKAVFDAAREINVDVDVCAATRRNVTVTASILVEEGFVYESVREKCSGVVWSHFTGLGVGEPFYRARLIGALLSVEGVGNCAVNIPSADVWPKENEILKCTGVSVSRMEGV